jgi:hypothetical protein
MFLGPIHSKDCTACPQLICHPSYTLDTQYITEMRLLFYSFNLFCSSSHQLSTFHRKTCKVHCYRHASVYREGHARVHRKQKRSSSDGRVAVEKENTFRYVSLYVSNAPLTIEGVDLSLYPNSMNIEAVVEGERSVSLGALTRVMCRTTPTFSAEEKALLDSAGMYKMWPWFTVAEETVLFEQPGSPWYFAGRAVASYECR